MLDPQEAWILSKTFYCPRLRIKLTPERCDENRKGMKCDEDRKQLFASLHRYDSFKDPLEEPEEPPCSNCKDWKTYSLRVGKSKEDEENHRKERETLSNKKKKLFQLP